MGKMTSEALALPRPSSGLLNSSLPSGLPGGRCAAARPLLPADPADRRAVLTRAVQLQVIPHLRGRSLQSGQPSLGSIDTHVERLAALSLEAEAHEVLDFVAGLLEEGFDADAVFLELLTPAAQRLGQYWLDDVCTFADVTVGVGHLQTAMHALRPAFLAGARLPAPLPAAGAPRALLLPLPGEQHSFGASMLCAFFARAGWDVWSGPIAGETDLLRLLREDWIDLLGLSAANDVAADETRRQLAALRAASRNDRLVIMVGGLPFARDPSLAEAVGADGTALDGAQAVEVATALLPARSRSP